VCCSAVVIRRFISSGFLSFPLFSPHLFSWAYHIITPFTIEQHV
jgi:hypothetical protein